MGRQIGLRDLHVCTITKDDATGITYGAPVLLERSITAKISPKTNSDKLYSDDSLEEVLNVFDSIDVEFEVNDLSMKSRALLQGAKLVSGVLTEGSDDSAPEVAIGFRSQKSNKKDFRYVWLLKGKFETTEDNYETVADKAKAQTATIKGTFGPTVHNGKYRHMTDSDAELETTDKTEHEAVITGWFNGVPTYDAATGKITAATKPAQS